MSNDASLASAATHGRPSPKRLVGRPKGSKTGVPPLVPSPDVVWLTLAQVAARWQTSTGYVRAMARSGRLRTTKIGRHHRVHVSWADEALGFAVPRS